MSEEDKLMKNKLSDIVEYIRHSTAVLENLEERIDIFSEIIDKKNKELLLEIKKTKKRSRPVESEIKAQEKEQEDEFAERSGSKNLQGASDFENPNDKTFGKYTPKVCKYASSQEDY